MSHKDCHSAEAVYTQFAAAVECADNKNFLDAIHHIKNCMKIEHKEPYYYGFYAKILCDIGKYDLALFEINLFLKRYPDNIEGLIVLGDVYFGLEEWNKAEKVYRKILTIDICNSMIYNNFGYVHIKTGRYEEAKKILETGLRIDPNSDLLKANYREALSLLNGEENGRKMSEL